MGKPKIRSMSDAVSCPKLVSVKNAINIFSAFTYKN